MQTAARLAALCFAIDPNPEATALLIRPLPPTPGFTMWAAISRVYGPETRRRLVEFTLVAKRICGAAGVQRVMVIQTAEGKRSIDDDLVLCIDRHRNEGERCMVTIYLVSGEQVTGILETAIPDDDSPPLAA